jgi:hypothetical protein
MKYQNEKRLMGGIGNQEKTMDAKLNNFNTPVDRQLHTQSLRFSPGNHVTTGGHRKRYDFITSTFTNYLKLSPKNQVCQIGEYKPYIKGTRNADLKMKPELNGIYGHLAIEFSNFQ